MGFLRSLFGEKVSKSVHTEPPAGEQAIDVTSGYGAIRLNEHRDKVLAVLGKPDSVTNTEHLDIYYYEDRTLRFGIHRQDNCVDCITFGPKFAPLRTLEGIGGQTTVSKIREAYGAPRQEKSSSYGVELEYPDFAFFVENGTLSTIDLRRSALPVAKADCLVTEVRELSLRDLNVSYEGNPAEVAESYSAGHRTLEPLVEILGEPTSRAAALRFLGKLRITNPGDYSSPYELFRSTASLIATGEGKTTLKAWAITEQSLGAGPNVLVVFVNNPATPTTLVCCKIARGTYLARYAGKTVPVMLGLQV